MNEKEIIKIVYVDDKIDLIISEYLDKLEESKYVFKYFETKFDSNRSNYKDLLNDDIVSKADVVIIDSKLFENGSVTQKFSGEEFKAMYNTIYPYSNVIVISKNDELEKYGTIKKYSKTKHNDSNDYYDTALKPLILENAEKIIQSRQILKALKKNISNYENDLIVDKIQNMMTGASSYRELTDEKIDELIRLIESELIKK
ncbi:hypothetical protein GH811_13925 [Acetobacterium malicum]|uniref:Response regulator n=1 Tax=Acetobacterium malicum TaxID=52692 RepID=A0ABR6YZS4_9FIRM|nr:hypothetical protein [Acetobacterium malicum]MBC3900714.1 hypothetical protein [Acetobacterium malicum]